MPTMGNVTPAAQQSNGQLGSQTLDQINQQANGPTGSTAQGTSSTEGGKEVTGEAPLAGPLDTMARWGAVHLHPHASYQFMYSTGIHNQPGNEADTYTHTFSPGVALDLGPHVSLDYTPSIRIYSQKDFHNTVDQSVDMHAGYNVGDWTLGLSQSMLIADEPLIQTASQVEHSDYRTGLLASYAMNDKITLATTAGMDLSYASGGGTNIFVGGTNVAVFGAAPLTDSQDYNAAENFDYKFNDKLSGGLSASFGYTAQTGGFRSIQENFGAHVGWHPGTKLSATISGGFEHRNFLDSKTSSAWNPVYSASIDYHMFQQTRLSVYANRSTEASIFDGQLSENTGVGVGLQQRLLGRMHLTLGFGYNQVDYQSTETTNLAKSRGDSSTSYTAGLTVPFLTRCSFATFYQYSQNNSSQKGFSYESSQVAATLSWSY